MKRSPGPRRDGEVRIEQRIYAPDDDAVRGLVRELLHPKPEEDAAAGATASAPESAA